jgi:hypothetical protein
VHVGRKKRGKLASMTQASLAGNSSFDAFCSIRPFARAVSASNDLSAGRTGYLPGALYLTVLARALSASSTVSSAVVLLWTSPEAETVTANERWLPLST